MRVNVLPHNELRTEPTNSPSKRYATKEPVSDALRLPADLSLQPMPRALTVAAVLTIASASNAGASVTTELVASGLNRPIYAAAPSGDARLFIVEQKGTIQLLKDGSILPDPFLDISTVVTTPSSWSEQGLLGLAFHPDFATNRRFFVHYTDLSGDTVIARYEANAGNPDIAVPSSAEIVLTADQPVSNHNCGSINFGPDGYLYFGFGDGGGTGDPNDLAQDPSTLMGKFIRIDVDSLPYSVPLTNPFVGVAAVLDEIWAVGLRNPYRWSFDRSTGDLWIADVGQTSWEEINYQPAASTGSENYGWSYMEGLHCYDPPVDCGADTLYLPIHEYSHDADECSVTGGYVYRGSAVPELTGYYLFGDYCSNRLWGLKYDGSEVTGFLDMTAQLNPAGQIDALAGIGEGGDGELYLVDREGTTSGEVYKIIQDPTGINDGDGLPAAVQLGSAFPNPTSARTELVLMLPRPSRVTARVSDAAGRTIRTLLSGVTQRGVHRLTWDGKSNSGRVVPSGVYFMWAEVDGEIATRKVSILR